MLSFPYQRPQPARGIDKCRQTNEATFLPDVILSNLPQSINPPSLISTCHNTCADRTRYRVTANTLSRSAVVLSSSANFSVLGVSTVNRRDKELTAEAHRPQ